MDTEAPPQSSKKTLPPVLRRLVDRKRVQQIFDGGRKVVSDRVAIFFLKNGAVDISFAVYTKKGLGGAVVRNRTRRVFKEAIRKEVGSLTGIDLIFIPRKGAVGLGMQEVATEIARLFRQVARSAPALP
jgi:ribonuclease P protein component